VGADPWYGTYLQSFCILIVKLSLLYQMIGMSKGVAKVQRYECPCPS
jgi:hypothetical protein